MHCKNGSWLCAVAGLGNFKTEEKYIVSCTAKMVNLTKNNSIDFGW